MAVSEAVARRYADAYFELARQRGEIASWREQLARAAQILEDPEFARLLANPALGRRRKAELVMQLLEELDTPARNLVRLMLEHNRLGAIGLVLDEYDRLADRASGVVRAEVTAAVPVDDELRERITRTLSERLGGDVQTRVRQDPSILGGLVIHIGDRVIDSSIRTRLQLLQAALT